MKKTIKKIVSVLLALAMVITSIQYTPKTVSAAEFGLTSEGKTYTINLNGDGGVPGFVFQGAFENTRFAFAWGSGGTLTPTISSNGETVATLTAVNNGGSIYVANGLNELAAGTYDFALVGGGDLEGKTIPGTLTITGEGETTTDASFVDGGELLKNTTFADATEWNIPADTTLNGNGSVSVKVPAKDGGENWSTQLVDNGIKLTEGKWYVAKVTITSDVARNFQLIIQSDGNAGGDWSVINSADSKGTFAVEAGVPYTYTVKFQANGVVNNYLYGIMMGYVGAPSAAANVTISNVSLKGYNDEPTIEEPTEGTTAALDAPEDFVLYNYRQTGEGYKVVFDDPNSVTVGEGETYAYEVYVDNGGYKLIGTVSDSEEFISAEAIDALGLGENVNYAIYIKAVLTKADGTRVESEAGRGDITYRTSTTTTKNTGIPQIIIQTANNNVNLLTDTSKKKTDSTIIVNDKDGNLIHSDFGTANTRGNSTVYADKKAYNFKFDSKYDLLGLGAAKKFSLLANAFDKSLLRNKLAMDLGNAMGIPYNSKCTYVDVYVDGKYLGNYLLIESIEEGKERVNIDSENDKEYNSNVLLELENSGRYEDGCTYITTSTYGEVFVMGSPEKADDITEEFFAQKVTDTTNALNAFETALKSNDYATFSTLMDVDSFVNFYIVTEFFKQQDIAFSSTRFFIKDGKLYAGPLWDFDLSSGNLNTGYYSAAEQSPEGYHTTVNKWFNALMQNATFKRLVKERFNEMLPTIKSLYEGEGNTIDTLLAEMGTSAAMNYTSADEGGAGWSISQRDSGDGYGYANSYSFEDYEESVEHLRTWLADRTAFLEEEWAIEETEASQYEEWIASKIYNMALGKTVTPYKRVNEGDLANINDGKISLTEANPPCAALAPGDAGWENAGKPVYATIDLGAYYDASTIDEIFIQYKDNAANDTVVGRSYIVQYSTDNVNFYDAVPEKNVSSLDVVQRYTVDDVSSVTGGVRYVRVYYPTTPDYGIQISEIAILDTDGNATEVEQVTLDRPEGFTATSEGYNSITATVTGEGQDGYTYNILIDGEVVKTGVQPGETVTITGVKDGTHSVTAVSAKDGWYSAATEAVSVDVEPGFTWNGGQINYTKNNFIVKTLTINETEYYNYVTYPGLSATSTATDPASYAIDGDVGSRWGTPQEDPHSITINLGTTYNIKALAALWETASSKDFTVEVSTDGTNFTTVATIEDAPAGADRYDLITLVETVEAQYVRITGTSRTTGYGHSIWELGIYGPDPYVDVAPDTSNVDTSSWTSIPVKGDNAASITNKYYINTAGFNDYVNDAIWGVYAPHTSTDYHANNVPDCILAETDSAISFAHKTGTFNGTMSAIWVDGVKYEANVDKFSTGGNLCEMALDLFPLNEVARATETIHYVSVVNTAGEATSFAIRVTSDDVVDPTTTTNEAVENEKPATPVGFGYAGNDNLPYYWAWQKGDNTAVSFNVYINGTLVTSVVGESYNGNDYFANADAGDYTIEIKAVNSAGVESDPATVTYTKVEAKPEVNLPDLTITNFEIVGAKESGELAKGDRFYIVWTVKNIGPADAVFETRTGNANLSNLTLRFRYDRDGDGPQAPDDGIRTEEVTLAELAEIYDASSDKYILKAGSEIKITSDKLEVNDTFWPIFQELDNVSAKVETVNPIMDEVTLDNNVTNEVKITTEGETSSETTSEAPTTEPDVEIDYSSLDFVETQGDPNLALAFVEGDKSNINYSLNQGTNFYAALYDATVKPNYQKITCNGNVQETPAGGANFWIPMADLVENSYNVVEVVDAQGNTYHFVIRYGTPEEETTTEEQTTPAITDWIQLNGTSVSGATIWVSQAVANTMGDAGLRGYYDAGTSTNWNISEAFKAVDVFGFVTSGNATSVVIDGVEYSSDDVNVCFGGDCVYINQALVDAKLGETKYYTITATGTNTGDNGTFIVKVVGEQTPDISNVTIDGWTEVVNGTGKAADGSTYYYATTNAVTNGNMIELRALGTEPTYGATGTTLADVPVFAISVKSGDNPESIWITTVDSTGKETSKKITDTKSIYINGDCIQLAQSLFDLGNKAEETYYVTLRYNNGTDATLPLKVVAGEKWSDWVAMNDASGANTVDYYYSTLSSNTVGIHVDTRELPDNIIAVFTEGLSSAKLDGVEIAYEGAGVQIKKSNLVEGQEYVLEVVSADGLRTSKVKFKYEPAPDYAPTGLAVSTDRGATDETTDDSAVVTWVPSDDAEGCTYKVTFNGTTTESIVGSEATFDLSDVEYGTYDVVLTTYDADGNEVDTQTITYRYLDPYAVDSTVNFNNTLWEKFRYQAITWTKVEAAKEYAIYADGVLVGTTTDLAYNVDAYNYATNTVDITDAEGNVVTQATTVGAHTTTVVAVFEGDAVPESLEAVNTGRVMGTNDFSLNVNYIYGKDTDVWNDSGVDSKWNFTVSEAVAGQISEGASVIVDYDATGAAEIEIVDNGKHDGGDQEWTIKAAIYDEAILKGEKINLTFDIIGPANLVGQQISIKCAPEEVYDNGSYAGEDDIYEEAHYTFEELKDEEGNVIGSIIHYSNSFDSTHDSYDLLFGLGELEPTTLTLTDASATKVYGVTSVSASGIVNTENTADNSMYISWETNVPDLLKNYYTYTLKVYDAEGNVVIEDDNAKSGTIYEGMNADLVAGTYRVEVSSIYDGTITATAETTATIDVNAALQPDLVISDISIVDPSIEYRIGDTVQFNVTITNVGSADATITENEIVAMLYTVKDGEDVSSAYQFVPKTDGTATIAKAGGTATLTFNYDIKDEHHSGDYLFTFRALADERGVIAESNENNNTYTKTFMFNPALKDVTFANDGEDISASWPTSTDSTVTSYLVEYTDSEGNVVKVNSTTPSITLPDGTWFKNDSEVKVTAICNDGTEYLYAEGTALADLVIETMDPADGVAYVGENVNFVATVKNIGVAPATSKEGSTQEVAVTFTSGSMNGLYASDYVIGADNQPIYKTLNPNDSSTIYLYSTYAPTVAGTEEYSAVTDDINRILESKDTVETAENNNNYSGTFVVINKGTLDLNLVEEEGSDAKVTATWNDPNTDLTPTGYKLTYTNADGETKTVEVDAVTTYTFEELLKNNTDVTITVKYEEYGDVYYPLVSTKALADLIVEDIIFPLEEEGVLYTRRKYDIEVVIKNIGTADVPATGNDVTQHYGWWIIEQLTANSNNVSIPNGAYSIDGLNPGASDTLTFTEVSISEEGTYDFTAKVDYPDFTEAEAAGFIAESDESNNSLTKPVSVQFKQNTDTEWTRLVSAGFIGEPAEGDLYLFPVANGSQNAYIDYKILDTTVDYLDWQDLITRYVGYQGANMSIHFNGATNEDVINYLPEENGVAVSNTVVEFAQVPVWNEFVKDENGDIVYGDDGKPLETTPDPNSEELRWIDLATKSAIIVDENGNHLQEPNAGDSPITYNGNGINFYVGNFGLYKCYILKFTTPVMNEDGTQATDKDGNPVYESTTVAFRVTDDTVRTNNWMQALNSDSSDPNRLPIPYCGGDEWAGTADIVDPVTHKVMEGVDIIDDTKYTDNEHEDTEGSQNYETIGAIWYDASDIMLSSVSVYNGNWLSVSTSQYLKFDKGDENNAGEKKFRVGIARANTIPDQNNKFIEPEDDENFAGFVLVDPNGESEHLGIQGTNTVEIGLPWLLQELPTHSELGGKKDVEYYWIRIYADYGENGEGVYETDAEKLQNYVDIPITVYYDVPMIEGLTGVSVQETIDMYETRDQFMVTWTASDHQNAYGYTYKIFAGDTQIGATEGYTGSQMLTFDYEPYADAIAANGGKISIVSYWCEQTTAVEVEIAPEKDMGWYDIDGESSITIQAGQKQYTELPGQMRFYYERDNNHSTVVAGYNGHYIALNGNIQWFNKYSQVYVANDPFWSENDGKDPEQIEHNDGTLDDELGIPYEDLESTYFEGKTEGVDYNEVETYMGSTIGQIQILAKNLFTAGNQDSYYVAKVVSPRLVEVPVAEGSVATTWVPAVETVEGTEGAIQDETTGKWYVAAEYDEEGNVTNGELAYNEPVYIRFHSTVETGNVELKGFQMNTDSSAGAVSEYSPSFRVVSRAAKVVFTDDAEHADNPKVEAVVKQGTIYALASDVDDTANMTITEYNAETGEYTMPENIYVQEATQEYGILQNWTGAAGDTDAGNHTYFAVTFKPIAYVLDFLADEYSLRAYAVTETGEIVYDRNKDATGKNNVRNTSVYEIAEYLYQNSLMSSELQHNFLYDNVLNIISIRDNRTNIGGALLTYLEVGSKDDANYTYVNTAYRDLFYYIWYQKPYRGGAYTERGEFTSLTDGNEAKLVEALNAKAKANGEYTNDHYRSTSQWIYENTDYFYTKVTYNPKTDDTTVDAGTQE